MQEFESTEKVPIPEELLEWVKSDAGKQELIENLDDKGIALSLLNQSGGNSSFKVSGDKKSVNYAVGVLQFLLEARREIHREQKRKIQYESQVAQHKKELQLGLRVVFELDERFIGNAIGKNGSNINRVMEKYNCKIDILGKECTVVGDNPNAVLIARSEMEFVEEFMPVENEFIGAVVGKEFANFHKIRQSCAVDMELVQQKNGFNIFGLKVDVARARKLIQMSINAQQKLMSARKKTEVQREKWEEINPTKPFYAPVKIQCSYCNRLGHKYNECRDRLSDEAREGFGRGKVQSRNNERIRQNNSRNGGGKYNNNPQFRQDKPQQRNTKQQQQQQRGKPESKPQPFKKQQQQNKKQESKPQPSKKQQQQRGKPESKPQPARNQHQNKKQESRAQPARNQQQQQQHRKPESKPQPFKKQQQQNKKQESKAQPAKKHETRPQPTKKQQQQNKKQETKAQPAKKQEYKAQPAKKQQQQNKKQENRPQPAKKQAQSAKKESKAQPAKKQGPKAQPAKKQESKAQPAKKQTQPAKKQQQQKPAKKQEAKAQPKVQPAKKKQQPIKVIDGVTQKSEKPIVIGAAKSNKKSEPEVERTPKAKPQRANRNRKNRKNNNPAEEETVVKKDPVKAIEVVES
eukprot:TRINITY_DN59_c0_g1_i2.p1 TRINITY_DN59_c0_g1~~TRINITY_DN59_c0_g1_i2.p1  ORF type:complete len:632 (+),score=270.62 TRINITY_DN59_c0_g1_i2:99-1994(+)